MNATVVGGGLAGSEAAWALAGSAEPPIWPSPETTVLEADPTPDVREAYAHLRDHTTTWNTRARKAHP